MNLTRIAFGLLLSLLALAPLGSAQSEESSAEEHPYLAGVDFTAALASHLLVEIAENLMDSIVRAQAEDNLRSTRLYRYQLDVFAMAFPAIETIDPNSPDPETLQQIKLDWLEANGMTPNWDLGPTTGVAVRGSAMVADYLEGQLSAQLTALDPETDLESLLDKTEQLYFGWSGAKGVLLLQGAGGAPSFQLISPLANRDEIVRTMGEANTALDALRKLMVASRRGSVSDELTDTFLENRDTMNASLRAFIDALRAARLPA